MTRVVWITRTSPEAAATAERVAALGHTPVVAPVLEARPIEVASLDLTGVDALAFTSGHALAAFQSMSPHRDVSVFAVGDATAQQARAAGFARVQSADGDAAALAALIAQTRPRRVLVPTAREPAADLAGLLAGLGVAATAVAVYETVPTDLGAPPRNADTVLIHSARAGALAADLIERLNRLDLEAFAISAAAARPLAGLGLARLDSAPFPKEAALLDLL